MKKISVKKIRGKGKERADNLPQGLSLEAQGLWRGTLDAWAMEDAPALLLLQNACRCVDRLRAAEKVVAKEGQTYLDRFGQIKLHPAMNIVRDENTTLVRILKQLGLDVAGAGATGLAGPPEGM